MEIRKWPACIRIADITKHSNGFVCGLLSDKATRGVSELYLIVNNQGFWGKSTLPQSQN